MFDYSKECTAPSAEPQSSRTAFAIDSSWSLLQFLLWMLDKCQGHAERKRSDPEWSGVTLEWKGFDNKSRGTTLASARVLCLDRLSHVWLRISGGLNCCQESRRGVV